MGGVSYFEMLWSTKDASENNDWEVQVLISFNFNILQMQNVPVDGCLIFQYVVNSVCKNRWTEMLWIPFL